MPDETKAPASAPAPKADVNRGAALADMLSIGETLRLAQQQATLEAMQLPEKRLDDASPEGGATPYTLRKIGDGEFQKINAWGDEVDDKGELTEEGKKSATARAQAGIR